MEKFLWHFYGYVYDGLRSFYPYKQLVSDVAWAVSAQPESTILELGCGTGNVLMAAAKPNCHLIGVDGSASMLSIAKRKFKREGVDVTLVNDKINDYLNRCQDESVDYIILCNVVYTIQPEARAQFWKQIIRIIKKGGRVIIADPEHVGQESLVHYHLQHDHWWRLLSPRLIIVGFIDKMIDHYIMKNKFELVGREKILKEIKAAGATPQFIKKTYGDAENGLDVLITAVK